MPENPNTVSVHGFEWVEIQVCDGPHKGLSGWVPSARLGADLRSRLRAHRSGTTGLTGTSYGGEELWEDGIPILVPSAPGKPEGATKLWKLNCRQCGCDRRSHEIHETKGLTGETESSARFINPNTKDKGEQDKRTQQMNTPRGAGTVDDARTLYRHYMNVYKKENAQHHRIMLGVLHVAESDNVYAAHSGALDLKSIQTICKDLRFRYAGRFNSQRGKNPLMTRGGTEVRLISESDLSTCAAPKLITTAIQNGEYPIAMTEIWFDPTRAVDHYIDGHTIRSCDKCRATIPYLLCPE